MVDAKPIKESLRDLYKTFAKYDSWSRLSLSETETKSEYFKNLLNKDLEDLSRADLAPFTSRPLNSWAAKNDLRHFLPRILELCAVWSGREAQAVWVPESIFSLLPQSDWRNWPADEQSVIEDFTWAWWMSTLSEFPSPTEIKEVLASIAVTHDVTPYLNEWRRQKTLAAFRHIVDADWFAESSVMETENSNSPLQQQIVAIHGHKRYPNWLLAPETITWLEFGYFAHSEEPWAADLALLIDKIRLLTDEQA